MERIFWVKCPTCGEKFYVDYGLRFKQDLQLACPYCEKRFPTAESPEIDDRWF